MKLLILNEYNLNLLGTREPDTYGSKSFEDYFSELQFKFRNIELSYNQTNIEGELIDMIQKGQEDFDGIILNAAAYTHTSVGIGDAVAAINIPVVDTIFPTLFPVRISGTNPTFHLIRKVLLLALVCKVMT